MSETRGFNGSGEYIMGKPTSETSKKTEHENVRGKEEFEARTIDELKSAMKTYEDSLAYSVSHFQGHIDFIKDLIEEKESKE